MPSYPSHSSHNGKTAGASTCVRDSGARRHFHSSAVSMSQAQLIIMIRPFWTGSLASPTTPAFKTLRSAPRFRRRVTNRHAPFTCPRPRLLSARAIPLPRLHFHPRNLPLGWYSGPFTLMLHTHIHNNNVLTKPYAIARTRMSSSRSWYARGTRTSTTTSSITTRKGVFSSTSRR